MDVTNFVQATDPFKVQDKNGGTAAEKIHIRVQQRNGRKCITTIQGLQDDLDIKKITRAIKKTYQCNGSVNADDEHGEIAQFSGDQRSNCSKFLVEQEICHADQIVIMVVKCKHDRSIVDRPEIICVYE